MRVELLQLRDVALDHNSTPPTLPAVPEVGRPAPRARASWSAGLIGAALQGPAGTGRALTDFLL